MSDEISNKRIKDLVQRVADRAEAKDEEYDQILKDAHYEQAHPDPKQLVMAWRLRMMPMLPNGQPNPYFDPDLPRALAFVDGGPQVLKQVGRAMAKTPASPASKVLPMEGM